MVRRNQGFVVPAHRSRWWLAGGVSCGRAAPRRSPGLRRPGVVLADDRLLDLGARRAFRELRLAEQVVVCHVADGRVTPHLVGQGVAEQRVRRRCVVDDECPFETVVSGRTCGAALGSRVGARRAHPRRASTRNPSSRREVPRCRSAYTATREPRVISAPWCSVKLSMATRMPVAEPASSSVYPARSRFRPADGSSDMLSGLRNLTLTADALPAAALVQSAACA